MTRKETRKKVENREDSESRCVPAITVFTPAYNRAHTLERTYESLKRQSNKNFIWLVVDDGSVDCTAEMVRKWQAENNGFEIQYIYQQNGGMHTAHNTAYENIVTELNVCIDSDDCMGEEAVEKILKTWSKVKDKGYAGIVGLDSNMETGEIIGKEFPEEMHETTLRGYYAAGGTGDKKLVYRTDIIKETPSYPVFEGEKYVGLAYKYNIIDMKYKLYVLNEVLCNVEYQREGSSFNMFRQYLNNPKGFAFLRKFYMEHPMSFKRLIMDSIHYCSSSQISHNKNYVKESPRKILTVVCTPFGWVLTACIRHSVKKLNHGWDQETNGKMV